MKRIRVHGLLCVDFIQFMKNIEIVDCMKFPRGVPPLGNLNTNNPNES